MTTYTINTEHNGIEITFDAKPDADTRATLKENGFRWHRKKALWYAKQTAEREALAEKLANGAKVEPAKEPAEIVNAYGVKVGDIFHASWGYDQTNNDFFQVIKLCGKKSVRVREVNPPIIESTATGPMAEDRTFEITGELLPPAPHSVFIDDQEHGDLKRLDNNFGRVSFRLSSFAWAHKLNGGTATFYESWYH